MKDLIKYIGLFLIAVGIVVLFRSTSLSAEVPLLVGLFILFISQQTREDERAISIRSSSAWIALILGYAIKLVTTNLYEHQMIDFQLTSINYFLIVVFALANIIRYSRLYIFTA